MIRTVATNSGHLGPNLGVVELTLAIHRVFDSPRDRVVFDTGHQSYVHKLVTGRREAFGTLRKEGGVSGYPSQAESEHDIVENSHASTALSYADGLAKAYAIRGEDRHVVAVIGDGALTGGMAWEALNNIAIDPQSRLVIVVNDNGRSYTPTIGGLADGAHHAAHRPAATSSVLEVVKRRLNAVPGIGHAAYDALHAVKKGMKDALAPQGLFEDLGLKYVGPIDGHDRDGHGAGADPGQAVRRPGHRARDHPQGLRLRPGRAARGRPVPRARPVRRPDRRGEAQGHASGPTTSPTRSSRSGERREDVVAITAAMMHPVGLDTFAAKFPERTFDVGIAEQHAATSAAGLAHGRPAPGLRRLRDLPQPRLRPGADGRARCTGAASPSCSTGRASPATTAPATTACGTCRSSRSCPGCGSPRRATCTRLRELLDEAVDVDDAPTVVRFPKGPPPDDIDPRSTRPAVPTCSSATGEQDVLDRRGRLDVHRRPSTSPSGSPPRASASPSSTRAGSSRSTRRSSSSPATTGWSSASRTTAASAAAVRRCCRRSTTPA